MRREEKVNVYGHLHSDRIDNLDAKWTNFTKDTNCQSTFGKKYLALPVSMKDTQFVAKNLPTKEILGAGGFTSGFCKKNYRRNNIDSTETPLEN